MINFSDLENLDNLINIEKSSLMATLSIQKALNTQVLVFVKNFMGNVTISSDFEPNDLFVTYINKASSSLDKSNNNILILKHLISTLNKILSNIKSLSKNDIKHKIKKYNSLFTKNIDQIYKRTAYIEKFIHEISSTDMNELSKKFNESTKKDEELVNSKLTISSSELDSAFIENTLVISEMKKVVILPYNIRDVKDILLNENDKYSSIQDVIDKVYTIPIKYYRFPSVSRFKESYKLITKKENGSKFLALSLAFELSLNYNLHPAIITACKNLDELDIYLACLETNTLDDFNYFDIKYEVAPAIIKNVIE